MKRSILVALALLATLAFVALGVWQVERRAWKLDLIARVESRIHAAPVSLAAARGEEYRRVKLNGTFLNDRATLVQALTERGAGFWLVTPLLTAQGIVLVNRGFVPSGQRKANQWGGPDGPVTVTGLLRLTEPKGGFLRTNDPGADRWYSRDVAAIARARALGPVAPFFVDADAAPHPGIYPIGGLTVVRFNNNHLVYALTWFGLAGLSGFAAFLLLRKAR
ncbi:SURF1 family protein [soil metagenome]